MQFNLNFLGRPAGVPSGEQTKADIHGGEALAIPEDGEVQRFLVGETNKDTSDVLKETVKVAIPMRDLWDRLPKKDNVEGEQREALRGEKARTITSEWEEEPPKKKKEKNESPLARIIDRIEAVVPEAGEHVVTQDLKNRIAACREEAGGDDSKRRELYMKLRDEAYDEFQVVHKGVTDWEAKPH